jgi:hypothetical protein
MEKVNLDIVRLINFHRNQGYAALISGTKIEIKTFGYSVLVQGRQEFFWGDPLASQFRFLYSY